MHPAQPQHIAESHDNVPSQKSQPGRLPNIEPDVVPRRRELLLKHILKVSIKEIKATLSSGVIEKKSSVCRNGITSRCPLLTG